MQLVYRCGRFSFSFSGIDGLIESMGMIFIYQTPQSFFFFSTSNQTGPKTKKSKDGQRGIVTLFGFCFGKRASPGVTRASVERADFTKSRKMDNSTKESFSFVRSFVRSCSYSYSYSSRVRARTSDSRIRL